MGENIYNDAGREYTNAEYLQMYRCYVLRGDDCRRAAEEYAARFPNARHPDHRVIRNIVDSMEESGCVNPRARGRQPVPTITPAKLVNFILAAFSDNENLSARICSSFRHKSHFSAQGFSYERSPYHYRRVQAE